ncbi:putative amino-acid permease C15C4,04c [Schizosaccharomyces pombe 972h-] [Rhizoctonia solani]|uniref:Putative amino-acid permease C15C4,04c [Schizosaccharomyces pombe 972h-] n=1 Tax=Rhizoctonia solani TaxID=456999 RepID=A0A0K6FL94_9AGAM|nr:putative amino-acid permease C15C4,04c [Schizosaccharomyces pombe 972h-] [Rhizoctonia solani]
MAPQDTKYVSSGDSATNNDDAELIAMGYKPSFKREFTNIATISFAFSIMGMCSSISTTFNTPLTLGGPASVVWCWILGATMCFTLGASIAEIVSAFPTAGGLYTASAQLVPPNQRAIVGWVVGWLNMLGQVAGVSSTEFGLSNMIWGAVVISKNDENFVVTQRMVVGLMAALLVVHGLLNSLATKYLARMTSSFVFINIGATILIIIVLLAKTPRNEMHPANYVFGSDGVVNQTGGWNTGLAFLFGLLSVQWTMTDYDATAHISEEVQRAAVAAPAAIFIAVVGTGLIGWLFNIVLVLCSGPLENLPGPSGLAVLEIMYMRIGRAGCLFLWVWVCLTAFFVVQTALQACSRTFYAFSRDRGLPDKGLFGRIAKNHVPIHSVWLVVFLSILPGLLDLASPIAAQAIFALTAMALDLSYIVPIFCRRLFRNHPDVHFKPGPFYMGDGFLGWTVNTMCILWTLFVAVILALPTIRPVTQLNMNYASVITAGVMICSLAWYFGGARKHYHGPTGNLGSKHEISGERNDIKDTPSSDDLSNDSLKTRVQRA